MKHRPAAMFGERRRRLSGGWIAPLPAVLGLCACAMLASPVRAGHHAVLKSAPAWSIVLHGGAGVSERKDVSPAREAAYREALRAALDAGAAVLKSGGSAADAVQAAIEVMEDNPLFNAGRGSVFTAQGRNELDAAIMSGDTLKAGAVAGVTRTRHPIALARAVMDHSAQVMLIGEGADAFAASQGLEQVEPSFFFTEERWQQLEAELRREGQPIPSRPAGAPPPQPALKPVAALAPPDHRFGTVGVVALDHAGHLAAGTSTGGLTGKRWGRVGDTPIIGAGTYASDASCAVSGTGTGEFFIRLTVAREICALVQYRHLSLQAAVDDVIHRQLTVLGGDGGAIAISPDGQVAWAFNTGGMFRARVAEGQAPVVAIYAGEP
jgi:beta-aspartyl-peptidase (threonine type)